MEGLVFEPGDFEILPFEANEFDAVLNVEALQCDQALLVEGEWRVR